MNKETLLDFISTNLHLNVAQVSEHFNYSHFHFVRIAKQLIGMGLQNYMNLARVELAKDLIKEGKLNKKEICFKAGFFSISQFNRVFKSKTGVSPSEFQLNFLENKA